ncbi:PAT complex subunit Asterix isoform X3 [Antennarius striatus]|uniref:PAT complex subunit Asterix isoform X3 n=1 Tax=Antennarius striatus TaxID=241820 RepID=UPI0035B180F2
MMSSNNLADPRRQNKILRYKPPSTETNPTLEDPTPDYMNLLGMIFSMCGLMLKLHAAHSLSGPWQLCAVASDFILPFLLQNFQQPQCRRPPPISGSSMGLNPTYYHAVYDVSIEQFMEVPFIKADRGYGVRSGRSCISHVTSSTDWTVPLIRRRGGVVDHRDIIQAHQAHNCATHRKLGGDNGRPTSTWSQAGCLQWSHTWSVCSALQNQDDDSPAAGGQRRACVGGCPGCELHAEYPVHQGCSEGATTVETKTLREGEKPPAGL